MKRLKGARCVFFCISVVSIGAVVSSETQLPFTRPARIPRARAAETERKAISYQLSGEIEERCRSVNEMRIKVRLLCLKLAASGDHGTEQVAEICGKSHDSVLEPKLPNYKTNALAAGLGENVNHVACRFRQRCISVHSRVT